MMTHRTPSWANFRKGWSILPILLLLFLFSSCSKEEASEYQPEVLLEKIYPTLPGKDPRIQRIIQELRATDPKTGLAQEFADAQATPLWECSILADQGIDTLLFVPVYSQRNTEEIQTIWTFNIHGDKSFTHSFYHSNEISPEEQWRFDYFTTFALGKAPKSGTRFTTPEGEQIPRGGFYVEHCVTTYYYAGLSPVDHWIPRTRCWIGFVQSEYESRNPDSKPGHGGGAGGDGPAPGYGGGGSPHPAPAPDPEPNEECFDKIEKTTSFKDTRADSIFNKLKAGKKLASTVLRAFTNKRPRLGHLYLKIEDMPDMIEGQKTSKVYGRTEFIEKTTHSVVIKLNSRYLDKMTDLHIATTLLHEMIHASLRIHLMATFNYAKSPDEYRELMAKGYPGIVDYYSRYQSSDPKKKNDFDHQRFFHNKESFISTILQMFNDPAVTRERCEALFWSGLSETRAYELLPQEKRNRYKDLWTEETKRIP